MSVHNEFLCLNRLMFAYVNVLVVLTKDVLKDFDVVLPAIAALEVRTVHTKSTITCSSG